MRQRDSKINLSSLEILPLYEAVRLTWWQRAAHLHIRQTKSAKWTSHGGRICPVFPFLAFPTIQMQ